MQISWLPDAEAHPLWPQLHALLVPAAAIGGVAVEAPNQLVWIATEGSTIFAVATTILWDDGEAEWRLAGGTRYLEWIGPMQDTLSEWATKAGADRLTILGRKGWARFAKRYGWVALGDDGEGRYIFEKGLNNGR